MRLVSRDDDKVVVVSVVVVVAFTADAAAEQCVCL